MILCFNIKIGDRFTSVYNNHTVQESVTKSNFSTDFIYLEDVSLNASTLQLISSRVPTPTLTRLSIKRNDFLLKEYIVVQFDARKRATAGTYEAERVVLATSRRISQPLAGISFVLVRGAARRGVRASPSYRNTINDVHFRELDSRLRQRVSPLFCFAAHERTHR